MAERSKHSDLAGLTIPHHVGIIMDGNGRWARKRHLPHYMGHRAGAEAIRGVVEACVEFGIKELTLYAFSTENWTRPPDEVKHLMSLVDYLIKRELDHLHREGVQIRQIGREAGVDKKRMAKIQDAVKKTRHNQRLILNMAFNYGGRAELVDAVRAIIGKGIPADAISEEVINDHLYTYRSPDPDLIIRTGGEYRLSNFLIWQAAYAEIYSADTLWPDFGRDDLFNAILVYNQRERRYGGRPGS
ncbi:MAG: polyprenyl diphosphate synthase [Ardenticatenaceae bacterium]